MKELFDELEAAVLKRNPGIATAMLPGLPEDEIRAQLKRVGMKQNIEPIVQLYGWHNGAVVGKENEAARLGIAPPVITEAPQKNIEFLRGLGYKIDGPTKRYKSFLFFRFQGSIVSIKHWKKFAATIPSCAKLSLRFVPFISTNDGENLALDVTPEGNGRIVMIGDKEKQVRAAYASFEEFIRDLIRANQTNELLSCIAAPGAVLELEPIFVPKKPKPRAGETIPATSKTFVLRTDYSNDAAWESLKARLCGSSHNGLAPDLDFISNHAFADLSVESVRSSLPDNSDHSYCFIADRTSLVEKDNPVLAVDLSRKTPKTFRVAASALGEVEDNLSIGNMSFSEFAKAVAADGMYRGCAEG
jgi:hypothetical protein